jgi:CheY-like chemotaxis protein
VKEIELRTELEIRKAIEVKLREAQEKAEIASKAKTDFLSIMSHELRNPIHAIIGFSTLLKQENQFTNPDHQDLFKHLINSSESLLTIVNEVLDYNKIENGKIELDPKPTNLLSIMETLIGTNKVKASNGFITLELVFDQSIPQNIIVDHFRLGQLIQNLVGNAIKFTAEGGVKLVVTKERQIENEVIIKFEVIDTGIGIAKAHQSKIFEKYTQAEKQTESIYGGTGLGLSISKNLIGLMGGELSLISEKGKGSNFYFSLLFPISQGKVNPLEYQETMPKANFNQAHLLVVDDNEMNLLVIGRFLMKWNVNIDQATNGKEGLEKAMQTNYDLILMDLVMPEMDGFETSKAIKKLEKPFSNVPIVALSANNASEIENLLQDAGFDTYINKPFRPQELHDVLARFLTIN